MKQQIKKRKQMLKILEISKAQKSLRNLICDLDKKLLKKYDFNSLHKIKIINKKELENLYRLNIPPPLSKRLNSFKFKSV